MLSKEVLKRESICADFTAALARRLPEDLRTPVAFCGPASFREPEIDNCWHPYMIKRGCIFFIMDQLPKIVRAFFGGVRRYILGRFGAYILRPHEGASVLGVTPIEICKVNEQLVSTIYCHPEDVVAMSWLVIDHAGRDSSGYLVSRLEVLWRYGIIVYYWWVVSFPRALYDSDWLVASVITLRWLISMQWVTQWMWVLKLRSALGELHPAKVHAVHESWPWARTVWSEAARLGIPTSTIQHASIMRRKLWYFPTLEERNAGMAVPDIFMVFSEKEVGLLQPFYPATHFRITCGPRYAHWKERGADAGERASQAAPILFATSVPWWDNEVVFQGMEKLVVNRSVRPIHILLHPLAVVPKRWKRWLDRAVVKGAVIVPKGPFQEEIVRAAVVVGMNTTILEEAIAMGRAVVVLSSPRYLSFGTHIGTHIPLYDFTYKHLEEVIVKMNQMQGILAAQGRDALGLDQPVARVVGNNAQKAA